MRAAQGGCLAVGAPLGWLAIRLAAGVSPATELVGQPALYAYLFFATVAAFAAFGALLGTQEERLLEANRRLDELSLTDALTGLRNVRYFRARLREELADATRTGRPLSLLIVDLDHFKSVNDRFGHPAGDRLLEAIAAGMRSVARQGETVARLGGEEFGFLLPDTGEPGARAAAER
ncbi:MAG TPA: GGDEF domain-containing protein, partial [Planctomycetota bacterium]|nr:GGDEF domain-containing protein [Planctomycetota bacterium]